MRRSPWLFVVGASAACATQGQYLRAQAPVAMQMALQRGRSELNCPTATGVLLSSDYVQPAVEGTWAAAGMNRLEYTIGVEGCSQRRIYVVLCQQGSSSCFAANAQGGAP